MEHFTNCRVSLEIHNGQMGSSNASDVKLFAVKVMPKWMGVNGNAHKWRLQLPVDGLPPWFLLTLKKWQL